MASVRSLDEALGFTGFGAGAAKIPDQGRILRNLIEGSDIVMSHILHFYHLAALDYIDTQVDGSLIKNASPWAPTYAEGRSDVVGATGTGTTSADVNTLVSHYVTALNLRRKAHEMAAHISGKHPCQPALIPGGVTAVATAALTGAMDALLGSTTTADNSASQLIPFIENVYIGDVKTVASLLSGSLLVGDASAGVGAGCMKYLAYGTFPTTAAPDVQGPYNDKAHALLRGGFLDTAGKALSAWSASANFSDIDKWKIKEYIKYSHYDDGGGVGADYDGLQPINGVTKVQYEKATGGSPSASYSWAKAPRYCTGSTSAETHVCEVGPLARVLVNYIGGNTTIQNAVDGFLTSVGLTTANIPNLRSVLGRHAARAIECSVIAKAMTGWLRELTTTGTTGETYRHRDIPTQSATGAGFTEAPRGALCHWIRVAGKKISNYQAVVPTTWNVSPKDSFDQPGPIETALSGVAVTGDGDYMKLLRIIRSFDPCIACTVHVVSPDKKTVAKFEVNPLPAR